VAVPPPPISITASTTVPKFPMADHVQAVEVEIDYESLGGGSLVSNLLAGAFAGIMVLRLRLTGDSFVRSDIVKSRNTP
jgi:hypothetical protein